MGLTPLQGAQLPVPTVQTRPWRSNLLHRLLGAAALVPILTQSALQPGSQCIRDWPTGIGTQRDTGHEIAKEPMQGASQLCLQHPG